MSTSAVQIEANRANAQLSTGPKTEEGKRRSSLNARRHHLTGQISTMSDTDRLAFNELTDPIIRDLAPVGAMEQQLALNIAQNSWRLNRIAAIEETLFTVTVANIVASQDNNQDDPEIDDSLALPRAFTARTKELDRLSLYEQRIQRNRQKNMAALAKMQAERKVAERESGQIARWNRAQAGSKDKAARAEALANGFVFSKDKTRDTQHGAAAEKTAAHPAANPSKASQNPAGSYSGSAAG